MFARRPHVETNKVNGTFRSTDAGVAEEALPGFGRGGAHEARLVAGALLQARSLGGAEDPARVAVPDLLQQDDVGVGVLRPQCLR